MKHILLHMKHDVWMYMPFIAMKSWTSDFFLNRFFLIFCISFGILRPISIWRCHLTSIGNPIVEIKISSYLHNGIFPYTGKILSLYWIPGYLHHNSQDQYAFWTLFSGLSFFMYWLSPTKNLLRYTEFRIIFGRYNITKKNYRHSKFHQ